MSDPDIHAQVHAHADRIRALETERSIRGHAGREPGFEGARELDRAWHENRSTHYLLKKGWADPLARWMFVGGLSIIIAGWSYLLTQ